MTRNGVKDMLLVEPEPETPKALAKVDGPMLPMIERLAALPDFDVAKLEKLLDMQERILDRQAEAAFNAAFAELQADIPTLTERARGDKWKYAPLEDIVEVIRPILKKHGFSINFRTEWPDKQTVKVVGILTHREGHSRESAFMSAADTSGSKNAIQALGSAVQYGRRYTTTDLLNITTRGGDNDGASVGLPEPPKGFVPWWESLGDVVPEGIEKYHEVWKAGSPESRAYVAAHLRATHEDRKAKAKAVSA